MTKAEKLARVIEEECKLITTAAIVRTFRERDILPWLVEALPHLSLGNRLAFTSCLEGAVIRPRQEIEREELVDKDVLDESIISGLEL